MVWDAWFGGYIFPSVASQLSPEELTPSRKPPAGPGCSFHGLPSGPPVMVSLPVSVSQGLPQQAAKVQASHLSGSPPPTSPGRCASVRAAESHSLLCPVASADLDAQSPMVDTQHTAKMAVGHLGFTR